MNKGILYLIPNTIDEDTALHVICPQIPEIVAQTNYYLAENVRSARRYISRLKTGRVLEETVFEVLDKNTSQSDISHLMKPLLQGHDAGVLSESGSPGIADPGALAVDFAHKNDINVVPLVGPSSILLALMASGFNGQKFCFHGYLPIDKKQLSTTIKALEKESAKQNQTQIWIETPYRNRAMFTSILSVCSPETRLCVACGITGEKEWIKTKKIKLWRLEQLPELHKIPAVFLIYAGH